jgi:hypothetical protein
MQVKFTITSQSEVRAAVAGFDTQAAFSRAAIDISGKSELVFDKMTIHDDVMVIANAVSVIVFVRDLLNGKRSYLDVHADPRIYGVFNSNLYELYDIDNRSLVDTVTMSDLHEITEHVNRFFELSFRHIHPALCEYLVKHKFLRSDQ